MLSTPIALALLACNDPAAYDSPVQTIDGDAIAELVLSVAPGPGTADITVRAINAFGIAVPMDGEVTLDITGALLGTVSATATIDALGHGTASVSGEAQVLDISIASSPDSIPGDAITGWIVDGGAGVPNLGTGWLAAVDAERMVAANDGVAYASSTELFWQRNAPGVEPIRIAALPAPISGLFAQDIDADGVKDLALWTQQAIYLLRGRSGGGFAWGTGLEVPQGLVAGVAVGLVDDDATPDLVVAWEEDGAGGFQALYHDGIWGFTPDQHMELTEVPWSVSVGDLDANGSADVSVMVETAYGALIRRFGRTETTWYSNGIELGDDLTPRIQLGSEFRPQVDVNGKGGSELIALGEKGTADGTRTLAFWAFDGNPLEYELKYTGLELGVGDVNQDFVADLLISESDPQQLRLLTSQSTQADIGNRPIATIPVNGPLAVGEYVGDDWGDVVIGGAHLALFEGGENTDGAWRLRTETVEAYSMDQVGPLALADTDGDGSAELYAVREYESTVLLQGFHMADGDDGYTLSSPSGHGLDLGLGSTGLDLALCDGVAYVLADVSGTTTLFAGEFTLDGGFGSVESAAVDVDHIACRGDEVIIAAGGQWSAHDSSLAETDSGAVAGGDDLGVVDGVPVACDACSLAVGDLDGDGFDELIIGTEDGVEISSGTMDLLLEDSGIVGVADVDGDGRLDVTVSSPEDGRVSVWRGVEGGLAPALVFHIRRDLVTAAEFGDIDGDGVLEIFAGALEGVLVRTHAAAEL